MQRNTITPSMTVRLANTYQRLDISRSIMARYGMMKVKCWPRFKPSKDTRVSLNHKQLETYIPDRKVHGVNMGPLGSCRPQMGPMLAPWTLLPEMGSHQHCSYWCFGAKAPSVATVLIKHLLYRTNCVQMCRTCSEQHHTQKTQLFEG